MKNEKVRNRRIRTAFKAAVLAGTLAALNPMAVQAGEGIEMSTQYPGVSAKAGESLDFDLGFESVSGDSCDAVLSVASMPEGWEGYFRGNSGEVSKVHIDENSGEEDSLVTFNLTLPAEAEEGTYAVKLKADGGSGMSDDLELEVTVAEQGNGQGNFSSEYPEQQGAAGTSFSFETTIVNNSANAQTYSLSAQAESGWQVGFTPSGESTQVASVEVEPGSSQGLTVAVTPPETIKEGEYTIPCTAVSANETLAVDLKVIITGSYEVSLSTPTGNLSLDAYANDEESVTLSITNTGNVDLENLNLTSSASTDWEVSFSESTIDLLEAGSTKEITAYITPAKNSITGDYVTVITVSNDAVTDSAEFRVSVKTRTTWGFVAILIIVVLAAGVGYVFKKYGRR